MNQSAPKVSVIMPVYNREKYIIESVKSITNQNFQDFEFIIIDDGSTDSTPLILRSFTDKRIKLILNKNNMGNYFARNKGMGCATGKYICVMDSDDIALPHRLQKQYDFMEKNQHFGLCGSLVKILGSDEIITEPAGHDEIMVWSLSNIMFRHPTVFMRTEFLKRFNLRYNNTYRYAGDYDFLVRAAHLFPVTNIQEVLLEYRKHPDQISCNKAGQQALIVKEVILNQLTYFVKDANEQEKWLHLSLMTRTSISEFDFFIELKAWANRLLKINNQTKVFHSAHLANFLKSLLKYIFKQYEISKKEQHISGLNQNHKYVDFKIFNGKIQKIIKILKPKIQLNFEKEWAVLPDFITELLKLTKEIRPNTIVECGSGLSTLICGYLAKNKMANHVFSLEHNKQFYEATKNDIQIHGLEKFVTLIYAPLKQIQIEGEQWQWYALPHIMNSIVQIDLLLVDGPPGFLQKKSRYPAFSVLKEFFHKNTVIVLDDSDRPDEQEIINRWILENPELSVENIGTVKGMSVIKSIT